MRMEGSPPPQTNAPDRRSPRLTGPVWQDVMSGCQCIYCEASLLVVRIVVSINTSLLSQ